MKAAITLNILIMFILTHFINVASGENVTFKGKITKTYLKSLNKDTYTFEASIQNKFWKIKTIPESNSHYASYFEAGTDGENLYFIMVINPQHDSLSQIESSLQKLRKLKEMAPNHRDVLEAIEQLEIRKSELISNEQNQVLGKGSNIAIGYIDNGSVPIVEENSLIPYVWLGLAARNYYPINEVIEIPDIINGLTISANVDEIKLVTSRNISFTKGIFKSSNVNSDYFDSAVFSKGQIELTTLNLPGVNNSRDFVVKKYSNTKNLDYEVECVIHESESSESKDFVPEIPGKTWITDKRFENNNNLKKAISFMIDKSSGWPSIEMSKQTRIFSLKTASENYEASNSYLRFLLVSLFFVISCSVIWYIYKQPKNNKQKL